MFRSRVVERKHSRVTDARNHQFFVGSDDAHGDAARVGGNHGRIRRVVRVVQLDAEETEAVADAGTNRGASLSDSGGEHQRV